MSTPTATVPAIPAAESDATATSSDTIPTDPVTHYATHPAQPPRESQTLAISSLVLGLVSLLFSYTFLVPIAGIVLGVMALGREPASRTMSIWGIVLSSVMLFGTVAAVILGLALLVPFGLAAAVI